MLKLKNCEKYKLNYTGKIIYRFQHKKNIIKYLLHIIELLHTLYILDNYESDINHIFSLEIIKFLCFYVLKNNI